MKIIKFILIFIIVVGILIALITGANIWWFWSIFNWLQNLIQITTGFDVLIAKALASIILAAIVMLPIGKVIMSFSPIPQKNKSMYRSIVFIVMCIFFLLSFFGSKDTYFNVKTGKALKYYSLLPDGKYRVYSEPGFDPLTGQKLKEVTGDIALKIKGITTPVSQIIAQDSLAIKLDPVEPVKKIVPVDNSRGIRKLKKEHRQKHVSEYKARPMFHQTYSQPEQFDYAKPIETVKSDVESTIKPEPVKTASKNGISIIIFENKSHDKVRIYDSNFNLLFEIQDGCIRQSELFPGEHFYEYESNHVKVSFMVEANTTLSYEFRQIVRTINSNFNPINYRSR